MATNSKREQIIQANIDLISSLSWVNVVKRTVPQYKDLKNFAITEFPVVAVVGRLPVPIEKKSSRTAARVDQIISRLVVDGYVYLMVNEEVDNLISNRADDIWKKLYTDPTRGNLVVDLEVKLYEEIQTLSPFAAFKISAIHKYIHNTGGI